MGGGVIGCAVAYELVQAGTRVTLTPSQVASAQIGNLAKSGKSVEMVHLAMQHSANMSIIHFPAESAVFVVDFLSLKRLPFQTMAGYDLDLWLEEIQFVEDFGAQIVMGGHGGVGTPADVAEVRQYMEELRDKVQAGVDAGSSLEELKSSVTMEDYSDWASYEDWLPLNIEGMYNMLTS